MRYFIRLAFTITLSISPVALLFSGCSDNTSDLSPVQTQESPAGGSLQKDAVVTIGNLSDFTGVAATSMSIISIALKDMVNYFNNEDLIPGVTVEVVDYDNQFEAGKDISGYEYLRWKNADLIWTPVPGSGIRLKPLADKDHFLVICASVDIEELLPAGYVFSVGNIPQYDAYTLLKWIAENDWDYQQKGPARVGGAAWADAYSPPFLDAVKAYAKAHPEQFEYAGAYITDFSFIWSSQIESLKDCDYLYPPTPMQKFVADYRNAGYEARFIGSDVHDAFMGMIDKSDLWEEIDGMLFIRATRWWNENGEIIDLVKQVLYENHPDNAEEIIRNGCGYLSAYQAYQMLHIIKDAAEAVGPENIDSQALYEAALSFTATSDGIDLYGFSDTKRCSTNYYEVCKADAVEKDLIRIDPNWLPLVRAP